MEPLVGFLVKLSSKTLNLKLWFQKGFAYNFQFCEFCKNEMIAIQTNSNGNDIFGKIKNGCGTSGFDKGTVNDDGSDQANKVEIKWQQKSID